MRPRFILSLLAFALLGACGQHDSCMVAANPDTATCAATYQPASRASLEYTANLASVTPRGEVITVQVDQNFAAGERAKIQQAVDQWNHVLNGHLRFDVSPPSFGAAATGEAKLNTWIVAKVNGSAGMFGRSSRTQVLAQTQPLGQVGGMVMVFADRLGGRDLTGVVLHEFGHVLGLDHDPRGALMSTHYAGNRQACVDRAAAEALAASKSLPLEELNWCGDPLPANFARSRQPVLPAPVVAAPAVAPVPEAAEQAPVPSTELSQDIDAEPARDVAAVADAGNDLAN